jgi:hypothetical protein
MSDTNVFGNPLAERTNTPTIGRAGAGAPPVNYIRPVVTPGTQAAPGTFACTQGTWDDASASVKYSYFYCWYEAATAGEDYKPMAIQTLATPKTSAASTAATKVFCEVTAVNRTTGASWAVVSNVVTAT